MDKRKELLPMQSKSQIKNDFKFFLSINNVPKEEYLIANIKNWVKVNLTKEDMNTPLKGGKSLQEILILKRNWRILDKYSKSLSLTETDILAGHIRKSERTLGRTIGAIVKLLINSESNNDWSKFLKNFFIKDNVKKMTYPLISQMFEYDSQDCLSADLKTELKEYLSLNINNEDINKKHICIETFSLKTMDNITVNEWLSEYKDECLLLTFLKEHIKILGCNSLYIANGNKLFFTKTTIDDVNDTNFKNILSSLSLDEKRELLNGLNDYWCDNESEFFNQYIEKITNHRTIGEDLLGAANLLSKIEYYILCLNPTVELSDEITLLEEKIQKYKTFLIDILDNKHVISTTKKDVTKGMDKTSILWEEMRMTMMIENNNSNKSLSKPVKF